MNKNKTDINCSNNHNVVEYTPQHPIFNIYTNLFLKKLNSW